MVDEALRKSCSKHTRTATIAKPFKPSSAVVAH
jgi:hypothetical protein